MINDTHDNSKAFFPKILYSNRELLKTNTWSIGKMIIIFILNISLICAPFFMSRTKTNELDVREYMPGIDQALKEIYQLELPCQVINKTFTCQSTDSQIIPLTGYELYLFPTTLESINTTKSRIIFYEKMISFHYVDNDDERNNYNLDSSYRLLEGMDFAKVNRVDLNLESYHEDDFYVYVNDVLIKAVLSGNLPSDLSTIYLAQFVQTILYVLIMSLMLMAVNLRRQIKKLYYFSALKYTIFGITGPALIAAVIGLFSTLLGTILWSAIYVVRIILLYTKINNTDGTF